jgi:hypothetical protein
MKAVKACPATTSEKLTWWRFTKQEQALLAALPKNILIDEKQVA